MVDMKKTVNIPDGISVDVTGMQIKVEGPKGKIIRDFSSPIFHGLVKIENAGSEVNVSTEQTKRKFKAEAGTIVAGIKNMMRGVREGWTYKLKSVYMHFPFTINVQGREVLISNFLGEKAPRRADIIGDTRVDVKGEDIVVTGVNLEETGQTAANLERATRITARDRRVFMDGIFITEKPE